jgi:hypothetical protein
MCDGMSLVSAILPTMEVFGIKRFVQNIGDEEHANIFLFKSILVESSEFFFESKSKFQNKRIIQW